MKGAAILESRSATGVGVNISPLIFQGNSQVLKCYLTKDFGASKMFVCIGFSKL